MVEAALKTSGNLTPQQKWRDQVMHYANYLVHSSGVSFSYAYAVAGMTVPFNDESE